MNTRLIMLPEQPILVSDEKLKLGDWCYGVDINRGWVNTIHEAGSHDIAHIHKKIIAGIEGLPSIDFSGLSEEVCKRIGWLDVDKQFRYLMKDAFENPNNIDQNNISLLFDFYKEGFKAAQSLNDKRFSLEDMRKAWGNTGIIDKGKGQFDTITFDQFIQKLSQPKVFNVEIEMGLMRLNSDNEPIGFPDMTQPKITNNSIKILKVL